MTRILVTGSRTWANMEIIVEQFDLAAARFPDMHEWTVVHGACPTGADAMVDLWCERNEIEREPHPANWGRDGRRAGFARNQRMVDLGADLCIAFLGPCGKAGCRRAPHPHPSHGTTDCRDRAVAAGIEAWTRRWNL